MYVGRALLGVAADLADHHDRLGLGVGLERLEGVDVRGADDRVAADADGGREAEVAQLVHHLVGQRARLGDEADRALAGDVGRGDADERLARRDDAGAVRADDAGLLALRLGVGPELGGVLHRDALGDDDERAPISASMASMTASLVKAGGTKTIETSAPVSAMASSTVPKTGSSIVAVGDASCRPCGR